MISIDDNTVGWTIGQWQINQLDVDASFLNKKFHEVGEYYLNREFVEPKLAEEVLPQEG
jgi:hypothetical protein